MNLNYTKTDAIKAARIRKGLHLSDMANLLGYRSPSTYKYIEDGKTVATIPVAVKISEILEEPVGNFFTLELQETQKTEKAS